MFKFENKIVNENSLAELKKIPDKSFNLIFADPPYNLQIGEKLKRPDDSKVNGVNDNWDQFKNFKHYDSFCETWLSECKRILKDNGTIHYGDINKSIQQHFDMLEKIQGFGYSIKNAPDLDNPLIQKPNIGAVSNVFIYKN